MARYRANAKVKVRLEVGDHVVEMEGDLIEADVQRDLIAEPGGDGMWVEYRQGPSQYVTLRFIQTDTPKVEEG